METFGCCSRYLECSNNRKCLYASDPDYAGCGYRKNLEVGRIFYGGHAFAVIPEETAKQTDKAPEPKTEQRDVSVFLFCFNRLFAVRSKQKDLSYNLTPEQADKVENAFVEAGIPFKLQIDSPAECVIDYPTDEDPAPANSRIVFEIEGEEYHLLNYNTWLIKKKIADQIVKAFDNHYINARLELRGQYASIDNVKPYHPERRQEIAVEIKSRPKPQVDTTEKPYVKASIFDVNKQPCIEIPEARTEIPEIIHLPAIKAQPQELMPIGSLVIASDKYWGTYRGELVRIYDKVLSDIKMAQVRIIEMQLTPRQDAIFDSLAPYPREPYPFDSMQVFYLSDLKSEETTYESLSVAG
jgi:mRNA-degrading endonuclease HigB of HigAB toxin-antitoxin module